jgi:Glycosyl hydrolases family 35
MLPDSNGKQDMNIVEKENVHFPSAYSRCSNLPCFEPAKVKVARNKDGFPSFRNFDGQPIAVTYDGRSILLNRNRALFLGGSMHPARATQQTWEAALDEAVHQGLNLITIYVIWAAHQHTRHSPLDWTLPQLNVSSCADGKRSSSSSGCAWDLAQAIRSAANRGLFVHIRLGPYVCAEYSYGGIPEWLPLMHANSMSMRRPNQEWMAAMEAFVTEAVSYLIENCLFAYQGGPIILAQIENELGGDVDTSMDDLVKVDHQGNFVITKRDSALAAESVTRNTTIQDYADWCGDLAQRLAPEVVWTMCNGLSANNTISTYNGMFDETSWMEKHGESGRIQVDQPAIWTEDEGNC